MEVVDAGELSTGGTWRDPLVWEAAGEGGHSGSGMTGGKAGVIGGKKDLVDSWRTGAS